MRASIAYFAGVATVVVAIAAGLGGGLLLGDVIANPQGLKQTKATRLDQRAPIPAINSAAQPVPFMAATQFGATVGAPQAPPQLPKQAEPQLPQQAQPQSQRASTQPAEPKQPPERNAPAQSAAAPAQPADSAEPSAARERAAPDDSFAKAHDADVRRETRRAERDRRRAERRAQREQRKWRRGDDGSDRAESGMRDIQSWPQFYRQPSFGAGGTTLFDD